MKSLFVIPLIFCLGCISQSSNKKEINYHFENAESVLPKPIGLVNDFSEIFTNSQTDDLEHLLNQYERNTTNQITILTVDSIDPYIHIEAFATDLGNYWRVGTAEKNNGLLIVLSLNNRQIRISTGLGVEKILSDEFLKGVIDNDIIPYFKENKYYEGITSGLDKIIKEWDKYSL